MNTEKEPAFGPQTAFEIMFRLYVVLKIAKIHDANNVNFRDQIRHLMAAMEEPLRRYKRIHIQMRRNAFFINYTRVRMSYADFHINRTMLAEMIRREIGTLTFSEGLDAAELNRFIAFFSGSDPHGSFTFEEFDESFTAQGFRHIQAEKAEQLDFNATRDKQNRLAAQTYFLGIAHLKEISKAEEKVSSFHVTKIWIQTVFNHLTDNESFLYGLTNIKNHDEYTLNHSVNVCILSMALGRRLGLSNRELMELGIGAFLHDLGKIEIPDAILNKPAALTPEEKKLMDQHARFGAAHLLRIQGDRGFSGRALSIAFEHHYKANKDNWPSYRKKDTINLFSRIVKITDYFDAITTKRVYRPRAFTREEALNIMIQNKDEEFDPLVFKVFVEMIGIFPIGSLVVLDTGEIGIVTEANPHASMAQRPLVKLIADPTGRKIDGEVVDLMDVNPRTRRFARTIVKTLDPEKYGIRVADYFLSQVSEEAAFNRGRPD
ncbi:MAG: HD-GYP domain-containing protein [Acidobacteria bacterium]|nr:HD-GYP domain-containing protein [Acidobacteriota bacterium]HOF83108.1 HD-GYP domain-containing protein [Candidatus Aminicenantes bacterium]NMD09749.1 HD-GYP domain-containing protein [Acidobacteriota bacterium]HOS11067.1 HD-GYP domain-containing protein [Candidatus Aminicenantes bacterium]HOU49120.1 HD-GYP domain-containing protein [Candidatus Aminicenantes bacterium]